MFGKVKKWLGIEGAKMELILPEEIFESAGTITGKVRFRSMNEQKVMSINLKLIEKYSRGRRKSRLVDEYIIGEIELTDSFVIPVNEFVEIDFSIPFNLVKSEMDEMEDKNIFAAGLVKAAKWASGVNSTYRIEGKAKVEGVALDPYVESPLILS
ncbi:MAG: sporulation protein [Saprospiraceae bacterium]